MNPKYTLRFFTGLKCLLHNCYVITVKLVTLICSVLQDSDHFNWLFYKFPKIKLDGLSFCVWQLSFFNQLVFCSSAVFTFTCIPTFYYKEVINQFLSNSAICLHLKKRLENPKILLQFSHNVLWQNIS